MAEIKTDKEGKRRVPRTHSFGYRPKANIRASYRLGITLIEQLESLTRLLSQWHKEGATMWPRYHYRITTSDIARNLIKLGLQKTHQDAQARGVSHLQFLLETILGEENDFEEWVRHLGYEHTKKYGAVGTRLKSKEGGQVL